MNLPSRIGVISDTHGLLRPEAVAGLRSSELIIHAGDVGGEDILDALSEIAPVIAVRGNTDRDVWSASLPESAVVEAHRALIYVLHDIHALDLNPAAAGFRIVISGHSHKVSRSEKEGVLYLNPGSAGPKRFSLPTTIASIDLNQEPWEIDFIDLC
ncbi:MAG TPA: metallophosphoesterase family protein [Candidatus Acidoferrales bacterium]|jgi:hypothetical protein|nr:metallophosphoesterase family protein [Candidatus Acidoferrales bacterium]